MKLKKLELIDVKHFDGIAFDFTYPKGHSKAYMPLDKICIIGQSGTGKTTLLNIIKSFFVPSTIDVVKNYYDGVFESILRHVRYEISIFEEITAWRKEGNRDTHMTYETGNDIASFFDIPDNKLISFPADFLANNDVFKYENILNETVFEFDKIDIQDIWKLIINSIKDLRAKEVIIRQQISKVAERTDLNADEIFRQMQPHIENLREIQNDANSPLKKLARECLDPILNYFNLKVNTDSKIIDNFDNLGFIEICNNHGEVISEDVLSTGTKQIIFSSLPFYTLNPKEAVILFDEPERSLYPNIQKMLVSHYEKFTENCQFFYATHSPIIASCFDPWEVFELKFNDIGKVYIEQYYEGEKHVDNYKIHPKYLTYELILKEVFDVAEIEGDDRAEKLTELAMYDDQLKTFKKNGDNSSDEFKAALDKYLKLAELLSFPKQYN